MDSMPKGYRVEICGHCRKKWNVSKLLELEPGEPYECPICESERKRREK